MDNQFPDGFLWGAATSSHQVEGGNDNNWTEWEKQGHVKDKQESGKACDHWNRYEQDYDLLKQLNLNAFRFSIEWSRVEPAKGEFDQDAIEHYRDMLIALRERGITPVVTLHHFTNPNWLKDWTHKENINHFVEYIEHIVSELGETVKYWVTINEPNMLVAMGYAESFWPPQLKSKSAGVKAWNNLQRAHRRSYDSIHKIYQDNSWQPPMVSLALNLVSYESANRNPFNMIAAKLARIFTNKLTIWTGMKKLDYIGVNYYFHHYVKLSNLSSFVDVTHQPTGEPKSDLYWDIHPPGLYQVLKDVRIFNKPVLITENGIADAKDKLRQQFIVDHLQQVYKAIDNKVDVIGYMHWSLIDNFEWADGFSPKFGLVAINYKNQKRTIRESSRIYGDIAEKNQIPVHLTGGKG